LQPVAGNNFTYSTTYFSGSWQGDVEARLINVTTGAPGAAVWSAKSLLDARTFAACDDRKILLFRGGTTLVPFTWETQMCPGGTPSGTPVTNLNGTEQALVGAAGVMALTHYATMTDGSLGTVDQQLEAKKDGKLVNFLRGQRGNEDFTSNSLTKLFRKREAVLGDIVDSQPVYVGQPFANYQENNYTGLQDDRADADAVRRCQRRHAARVLCDRGSARRQPRSGSLGGDPERGPAESLQAGR
jgi:type IV pilus assembly protein PilY1